LLDYHQNYERSSELADVDRPGHSHVRVFLGILPNQRAADKLSSDLKDVRKELADFRKQMLEEYFGLLNMIGDHGQRIVRLEERGSRST
jgi:hypothetical protein